MWSVKYCDKHVIAVGKPDEKKVVKLNAMYIGSEVWGVYVSDKPRYVSIDTAVAYTRSILNMMKRGHLGKSQIIVNPEV